MRNMKDEQMMNPETSALLPDDIANLAGLSYFPMEPTYRMEAQFTPEASQKEVSLNASTDSKISLVKAGTVTFNFKGESLAMSVFRNKNLPEFADNSEQLFIPFTDLSAGKETNAGGRYLPVEAPVEGGSLILDFNKAMNPYSAYSQKYISVVPPAQNSFKQILMTGERKYEDR
jgi:uncharacterized protein (DUF1684 family)